MKYFRTKKGKILAFEKDGSQDRFIPKDAVKMSGEEVNTHTTPEKKQNEENITPDEAGAADRFNRQMSAGKAQKALDNGDLVLALQEIITGIDPKTSDKLDAKLLTNKGK